MAGNPDESKLLLRLKGEIEPRMPQGANAKLSDAAIAKIERWIKEGATLDAGNDPKKPIASYAASADQVRKAEVAKLPPGRARQEDRRSWPPAFQAGQCQPQTRGRADRSLHDVQQSSQGPGDEYAEAARNPVWAPQADSRRRSHRLA